MTTKPTLCLDFDGVLHSYTSGWKGADVIPDPPVDGALRFLKYAQEHFTVVIFSSRSNQPRGIPAMRQWLANRLLDEFGTLPDWWIRIEFPTEKPAAFLTIDDRAITFEGDWPDPQDLLKFKPWNRRGARLEAREAEGARLVPADHTRK